LTLSVTLSDSRSQVFAAAASMAGTVKVPLDAPLVAGWNG
jgi:hypothetical protein